MLFWQIEFILNLHKFRTIMLLQSESVMRIKAFPSEFIVAMECTGVKEIGICLHRRIRTLHFSAEFTQVCIKENVIMIS